MDNNIPSNIELFLNGFCGMSNNKKNFEALGWKIYSYNVQKMQYTFMQICTSIS